MAEPIVIYKGPSALDGAPVVCIATLNSTNAKTGPMVQTWIMRADENPLEASAQGHDSSVCGDCPRRHSLGGDCYVTLGQAPCSVWAHWAKHGSPGANWHRLEHRTRLRAAAMEHGLRLGSYGDPAAVPTYIWRWVMRRLTPRLHTGYTHQWSRDLAPWYRDNLMASCDSIADAERARVAGWRYFLAVHPEDTRLVVALGRTVECPADRAHKPRTCETCGICDGAQGRPSRTSVYLVEHGARSGAKHKRIAALKVMS